MSYRKMIRTILLLIGFAFMPVIWIGMRVYHLLARESNTISLCELYREFWSHYKSGEAFGPLDE